MCGGSGNIWSKFTGDNVDKVGNFLRSCVIGVLEAIEQSKMARSILALFLKKKW